MAIATEIGRLQGAKQDLISRLKAKGVSVPENATLEEITPLVDNIDAGSGGGSGGSVETCTFVVEGSAMFLYFLVYQNALGEAVMVSADPMTPASGTYSAVCGSLVFVNTNSGVQILCENIESVKYGSVYLITAKAGETARLTVTQ